MRCDIKHSPEQLSSVNADVSDPTFKIALLNLLGNKT